MGVLTVAILIVSDTCSNDSTQDKTGPKLVDVFRENPQQWIVADTRICNDDEHAIRAVVQQWTDVEGINVVITSGGTGFAKRDVTPEAVKPILERDAPGLVHAMYQASFRVTPLAAMARLVAGTRKDSVILCVPGSPKGAVENIEAVLKLLPHASELTSDAVNSREVHAKGTGPIESAAGLHASHTHHCVHHKSNDLTKAVITRARASPYPMIEVDKALDLILSNSPSPKTCVIPIKDKDITTHIISQDIVAKESVPAYRASIVDGYAVIAVDGPGTYPVVSISHASPGSLPKLEPGQITRITTGAPLPPGADSVVMVEYTKLVKTTEDENEELQVEITVSAVKDDNIREIGSDVRQGDLIMKTGERISGTGGEIGLLASVGVASVPVWKKPVVGVLSTGDELVEPDAERALLNGEIRDSNRVSLLATIKSWGFDAIDLGIAKDQAGDLQSVLRSALDKVDVVITTGGVSMGEKDLLKPTIERALGGTIHFGRVAMKPGKPTTFATIPHTSGKKLIFALPGNPASAIVTFHLFVLPSLRASAGHTDANLPVIKVKITHDIKLDPRPEYHRVMIKCTADGSLIAESTGMQRSSRVASLCCNGFLCLPAASEDQKTIASGSMVDALLIDQLVT